MPHVTSFRFKAKDGERQTVIDSFERWGRERKQKAAGFAHSVLASSLGDRDEFMATVVFDSSESYNANSDDPEQHAWYQDLRSRLVADPEWFDGALEAQLTA